MTDQRFTYDKARGLWGANMAIVHKQAPQQLAFGWASVITDDLGRIIVDHDDDVIFVADLEKAAYAYVMTKRESSDSHKRMGIGTLVESVVLTAEKRAAMNLPSGQVGWWVGFHVNDDKVWKSVESGEYDEFSIGGTAERVPIGEVDNAVRAA